MTATARNEAKLAVHGGNPVRDTLLPYGRQSIDEEDIQAVVDVLRSEWVTTGPKVGEFEEAFAAKVGARFAVSLSSGTAALHGAVFAADFYNDRIQKFVPDGLRSVRWRTAKTSASRSGGRSTSVERQPYAGHY